MSVPRDRMHRMLAFAKRWRFVFWGLVSIGVIMLAAFSAAAYVDGQDDRKDAAIDRELAADQRAAATMQLAESAKRQAEIASLIAQQTKDRSASKQQLATLRDGICRLVWIYENPEPDAANTERAKQVREGWQRLGASPVLNCPDGIPPS